MAVTTLLRGITWDHPRGLGGLQATAAAWTTARPEVRVEMNETIMAESSDGDAVMAG